LIAATSHFGSAPRPAQVSPDGPRYFGGTFLPFQNACTASDNPSAADQGIHPLQLLFNLGTMPMKHFVNPLPQVHESVNGHP
jgi:hypothetical protein